MVTLFYFKGFIKVSLTTRKSNNVYKKRLEWIESWRSYKKAFLAISNNHIEPLKRLPLCTLIPRLKEIKMMTIEFIIKPCLKPQ